MIVGDNARIVRLVGGRVSSSIQLRHYAGATEHIVPRAVTLLDYSPYGDASYTTCNPLVPDWCVPVDGTGDEHRRRRLPLRRVRRRPDLRRDRRRPHLRRRPGRLALRQLRRRLDRRRHRRRRRPRRRRPARARRNGVAEPLYGLAATTQVTLRPATATPTTSSSPSTRPAPDLHGDRAAVLGRRQRHHLRRPRRRLPARRRGRRRDVRRRGAAELLLRHERRPAAYLRARSRVLHAGDPLGFNWWSRHVPLLRPDESVREDHGRPGGTIDFLLNFDVGARVRPGAVPERVQPVRDDG